MALLSTSTDCPWYNGLQDMFLISLRESFEPHENRQKTLTNQGQGSKNITVSSVFMGVHGIMVYTTCLLRAGAVAPACLFENNGEKSV